MSSTNNIYIKSIDGCCTLTYSKNDLQSNYYVKGTLIDKCFFGHFSPPNELILQYESVCVRRLISLIRDGTLDLSNNFSSNLFNMRELTKMLDYIAGENNYIIAIVNIINNGAMDHFGRYLNPLCSFCNLPKIFSQQEFISSEDLFFIMPFDENKKNLQRQVFIDKIKNGLIVKKNLTEKSPNYHKIMDGINGLKINDAPITNYSQNILLYTAWFQYHVHVKIPTIHIKSVDDFINTVSENLINETINELKSIFS